MSQPVRVMVNGDSVYYGFGPDSAHIDYVQSEHKRGCEPAQPIHLFGRHWIADTGWYVHLGTARMQWVPLD